MIVKALTLNTHSWVELFQIPKIKKLARYIVENDLDVVLLQEITQHQETDPVLAPENYHPGTDRAIHQDNYGHLLIRFLHQMGTDYHWSWVDSHQGWGEYDEGVAILTKTKPLQVTPIIMDAGQYTYNHVWRRAAIAAQVEIEGRPLWFASTHMNWWHMDDLDLFEKDFTHLNQELRTLAGTAPIVLAGDFNNGCDTRDEGYDQVLALDWHDVYTGAAQTDGEYTVHKKIAGWENATKAMRIDFFFTSIPITANRCDVVFKDDSPEAISDHSGVLIEFDANQLYS